MMKVDNYRFGSITITGKKYVHDVLIYPDGSVERRGGGVLMFGSHRVRRDEVEALCGKGEGPEVLVVGLGAYSRVSLDPDIESWAKDHDIELVALPSQDAVLELNRLSEDDGKRHAAIIHVTC